MTLGSKRGPNADSATASSAFDALQAREHYAHCESHPGPREVALPAIGHVCDVEPAVQPDGAHVQCRHGNQEPKEDSSRRRLGVHHPATLSLSLTTRMAVP